MDEPYFILHDSLNDYYNRLRAVGSPELREAVLPSLHLAIAYAQKAGNKKWLCESYARIGDYYQRSDFDSSVYYLNLCLVLALETGNAKRQLYANQMLAYEYATNDRLAMALEYYLEVLELTATMDAPRVRVQAFGNIGEIYMMLGNHSRAILYAKRGEEYVETTAPEFSHDVVQMYYILASSYLALGDTERALTYAERALGVRIGYPYLRCLVLAMASSVYLVAKDYTKAVDYAQQAYAYSMAYAPDEKMLHARALNARSNVYLEMKKYRESEEAAAHSWATDSTGMETSLNAACNLALANMHLGNKAKADTFFRKYRILLEERYRHNAQIAVTDMEVKYETGKKEQQILLLHEREQAMRRFNLALAAIALLGITALAAVVRLWFMQAKHTGQEKRLAIQEAGLKTEISIRTMLARELHNGIGSLLAVVKINLDRVSSPEQDSLDNAVKVLARSIKELRDLSHRLDSRVLKEEGLEAALNELCNYIPFAVFHCYGERKRLGGTLEILLYSCACELVNNSLRHAECNRIDVSLTVSGMEAFLQVSDDGKGFDEEKVKFGIGLSSIRSRLSVFGGKMEVISQTGKGTEIMINLKTS